MKVITSSGSRKTAVARASLRDGSGKVMVNERLLEFYQPTIYRMRMMEPLLLAKDVSKKVDLDIHINGGGSSSQADAARVAISRALVEYEPKLAQEFLDYDRLLLVADVRFKETRKPNCHGKARAKRQKSYR